MGGEGGGGQKSHTASIRGAATRRGAPARNDSLSHEPLRSESQSLRLGAVRSGSRSTRQQLPRLFSLSVLSVCFKHGRQRPSLLPSLPLSLSSYGRSDRADGAVRCTVCSGLPWPAASSLPRAWILVGKHGWKHVSKKLQGPDLCTPIAISGALQQLCACPRLKDFHSSSTRPKRPCDFGSAVLASSGTVK